MLFSFSKDLNFVLIFWSSRKTAWLERKRLIPKFMTSQPEKQTIEIHILPNISRSKGNQKMKFGQLIEYWETFLLKNLKQNVVRKLFPHPFLKNQYWAYLWINSLKFYTNYFHCMPSWRLSKYTETKLQTTCITLFKALFKKSLELVSLAHFLHNFWRKIFLVKLYSVNWPNSVAWLPLLREILGSVCIAIVS